MPRRDIKNAGWFEDFEKRCEEKGYSAGNVLAYAGLKREYLWYYRKDVIPRPSTRLKLENALLSYEPPVPVDPYASPGKPKQEKAELKDNSIICEGDKFNCPYLTYTSDKKGYCPLQRCKYIIKDGEVFGHVEEQ